MNRVKLWVIVTCMGRLEHLRRTAPAILARPDLTYCLVDYSCPDRSGDWLEAEPRAASVVVERRPNQHRFNKGAAYNLGAARASAGGATHLCFLDADTMVDGELFDWLIPRLEQGRFFIADLRPDGTDQPSLTGVLALSVADFQCTTGFDEAFVGWGSEDLELRLRLHLIHGLQYSSIPLALLRPIEHDDELRTRFYEERDLHASNRRNHLRMLHKLNAWRRVRPLDLSHARRLFFQGTPSAAAAPTVRR